MFTFFLIFNLFCLAWFFLTVSLLLLVFLAVAYYLRGDMPSLLIWQYFDVFIPNAPNWPAILQKKKITNNITIVIVLSIWIPTLNSNTCYFQKLLVLKNVQNSFRAITITFASIETRHILSVLLLLNFHCTNIIIQNLYF